MQEIDPIQAQAYLDELDKKHGKNTIVELPEKPIDPPVQPKPTVSQANELGWKNIPLQILPTKGKFYLEGFELAIRSATVAEVRHWSTIDENDMLSVDDQLNYILERCARVRIGGEDFSWREILEADRFFIIMKIQEFTFPNGENTLPHKFECTCEDPGYSELLPIQSGMLTDFDLPLELDEFYSKEERCYIVNSEKLNTKFKLYLPTLGAINKLRDIIVSQREKGENIDPTFIKVVPYLIGNWESLSTEIFLMLNDEMLNWHINKFTFIVKFAEAIQQAKRQVLKATCPLCNNKIDSRIFLDSSFTVKDLFLIPNGFGQLV